MPLNPGRRTLGLSRSLAICRGGTTVKDKGSCGLGDVGLKEDEFIQNSSRTRRKSRWRRRSLLPVITAQLQRRSEMRQGDMPLCISEQSRFMKDLLHIQYTTQRKK